MTIFDLVTSEERPRIRQVFDAVMAGEASSVQSYEVGLRRADGTAAIVEVTPQPVRRDGQIVAVHGIGRDITDRRRLESQARQSQKMQALGQLAAGVAHDVNNLLTGIMGYAELAVLGLDAVDTRRQPLTDLLRTAQRGAALTRQLLAFSRQQMLRPTLVDLNQTVRDLEDLLHRLLGERVVLRVTLADGVATVRLDPDQFSQVLINLVVNARDAMPGGGTLVLQTQEVTLSAPLVDPHFQIPAGSYALVSVSDTGAGMTREVLGHLFEPFFTTKPPGHGTGLGLATVYGIVRQSGGYIAVTSAPTQGSTFRLYFPRVDELPTANTVRDRPQPAGAAPLGGTERILLVDDDHAVRTSAAGALRAAGYTVVAAESGEVALELVRDPANAVDLVLLDVVLPGLQGPDVLRALRARLPTVRALFISGDLDPATRVDAVFSRVPVLEKPFTARQLTRAVREVLDDEGARGNL